MLGWKVVCEIDEQEVVAEVCSTPVFDTDLGLWQVWVYHDHHIKNALFETSLKVLERNGSDQPESGGSSSMSQGSTSKFAIAEN